MSKEEIKEQIADWEQRKFMNSMADHWTAEDYEFDRKCREKIEELKALLEEA